jgi:hypothetical protein
MGELDVGQVGAHLQFSHDHAIEVAQWPHASTLIGRVALSANPLCADISDYGMVAL